MTRYEPWGTWPRHTATCWNDVYDAAKARGWQLETNSNHNTKTLICPSGECVLGPIYSTAKGTESVAKRYGRQVKRCPHGTVDQTAFVERVKDHLETARRLLTAVKHLLANHALSDEIDELWAQVEQRVGAADDLVMASLEIKDWSADREREQAEQVLAESGRASDAEAGQVLDDAHEEVVEAEGAFASVAAQHSERAALEAEIQAIKDEIDGLRGQVEARSPDSNEGKVGN